MPVAVSNQWTENSNASPAPFYLSTNGYGVLRNTWAPGSYNFDAPTQLTHNESRFDATCLPRQDGGVNGRIGGYEIYVSDSTGSWGTPVATGTFADTAAAAKTVNFKPKNGRYVRLRALGEAGNRGPWTSAAEITATGTPVP
nr:discoidin domain-containing protein [Kitasatospora sp. CB02891]